ncbi:glycosyl hydrolases 15 family protein [Mycobacterium xenopi 3993]|nr:glycosyl hydrolases 15 family protein [Mycobacterium xenopi 3993]
MADLLVTDADSDCLHPSGRWQRAPDDPRIDAALLMPSIRGPIPTGDPRAVATLEAVRADLGRDGFVYRFQPDQRPLGQAEGAFLLCGFLMALADHQHGNHVAAARWFERNRTACGPPGLLTEEFDVAQRQLRGNLPQAFVHALLFETAHRLADGCRPPVGVGTG